MCKAGGNGPASASSAADRLPGQRGQEFADLSGGGNPAGEDEFLVDDQRGGGHHAVPDDRRIVGDLHYRGIQAEAVDGPAGDAFEVLAVGATGAEHLDDHDRNPFSGGVFGVSGEDEVEQVADDHDAGRGDGDERGEQRRLEHPAQQDQLGQAQRDDGHHEREQGAHRQALVVEGLDQRHDPGGVGVQRNTDADRDQDTERVAWSGVGGEEIGGHPAVNDGAQPDPDQQVRPDLLQDGRHFLDAHLDALVERQTGGGVDDLPAERGFEHERFDPFLHAEPAEDPAGDDRDDQSRADVDGGDLPAQQAEQHADGDLVHHRAGDQEAQRDPDRHPGGGEPDERRDGAAGAERGDHPEAGGHHIADTFPFATEQGAGPFDAHVRPQHGDDEDDRDQQQRDLDRVVHEEVHGAGRPGIRVHPEPVVQHRIPQPTIHPVDRDPARRRGGQGEDC